MEETTLRVNKLPEESKDIVHPLACEGSEWMGALLTMVDSLDTLWIMKLDAEFDEARKWISSYLEFNSTDPHINVFETTIRLLGGLLSAYTLSKDRMFLGKAKADQATFEGGGHSRIRVADMHEQARFQTVFRRSATKLRHKLIWVFLANLQKVACI
ncbi:hypothetical protein X801_00966 [Opisthorchis viverrini]|uniref:alpha-1,2-Mannosidase n=1 Tax=Opisthorchis viverrini TaxID=6198 RepID=A0A1S8X8X6_OPIVI|nr:hypothetical protein X801_00966 [Opisthorchis viverrini]